MKFFKLIPYLIIVFLLFRIVYLNKQNTVLIDKNATLEENLKNKTIIYKDKIIYKERIGDSVTGTDIKQTTVYVPVDGSIQILTPTEGQNLNLNVLDKLFNHIIKQEDGSVILVKDKGFTISPYISSFYSKEFEYAIQLKLFYWNRYGTGFGYSDKDTIFLFIDRNISDILSFTKNLSIQTIYGKNYRNNEHRIGIGLNVRL